MKNIHDCYTLSNGIRIPCIAFGTYKAAQEDNVKTIQLAIEAGYRYFDTASFYDTERVLGEAIKQSGIPREEFFVVSKVWKTEMGYANTKRAFKQSLECLQMEYLDGYLIHWPKPYPEAEDWKELDRETWRAMEELYLEGKIRTIGLSNFLPQHIEPLLQKCQIQPMMNQLEIHPGYSKTAAVQYCKEKGMILQAWSPIGRGRVLQDELIVELAKKYGVTPARICLRYLVQNGIIPLPKSSSLERMKENQNVFSFALSKEDMYRLETMPQTGWSGEYPDRERITE